MDWFIPLAVKSFLIAGGALLLLRLLKDRSAADRSWIAHLALAGLLLLPVATVALPTLDVAGPEFLVGKAEVESPSSAVPAQTTPAPAASSVPVADEPSVGGAAIDWSFWGYTLPAALLLLLTLIALVRLFVLKARATVLVDAPWLTALARAQKRMGFKHGTALLTSNELPSPISWGVVRPVILLNAEATESHDEAEAIITHELAHVAHFDWAKLLLARIAIAVFWFNPFVWLLAREAHQLREEAADDAVLATDIEDTDYARLLVGVARHECRGLLIGAHGVAPARNSLARRVKRVLDGAARRAPGGWRWGSAAAFFAGGMAVPVAALNLVPPAPASAAEEVEFAAAATPNPYYSAPAAATATSEPAATETATIAAAVASAVTSSGVMEMKSGGSTIFTGKSGEMVLRSSDGSTITVAAPDSSGRRRTVLRSSDGSTISYADARGIPGLSAALAHPHPPAPPNPPAPPSRQKSAIDRAIEMKAVGVTREYIAAMHAAAPHLGRLDSDDLVELKAVGVTPSFVRDMTNSGLRNLSKDQLVEARAVGIRGDYIRALAAAGYSNLTLDQLVELRAVGVTPAYIEKLRHAGYGRLHIDKLVELKALGITPEELRASERHGP